MQKIYLLKSEQNGHVSYLGFSDARTLAKMAKKSELEVPEAQRPIDEKRLELISKFVAEEKGTLATSVVIGTVDDRIQVHLVDDADQDNVLYYTEFPTTEKEFEKMQDSFDIMDGQHRVFSFLPEHCKLPDDITYDLAFEMYLTPKLTERQIIFRDTNQNQKPVSKNLLLWFRSQLGLLLPDEEKYYAVVSMLNTESSSPLKGRIKMSSEKIVGGLQSEQIIKMFSKAKLKENIKIQKREMTDDLLFDVIVAYLKGWELAVDSKFVDRESAVGPFWKSGGLKYMIYLLPTYFDIAVNNRQKFTAEFVDKKIKEFFAVEYGITPREFFDMHSEFNLVEQFNPFAGDYNIKTITEQHKLDLLDLKEIDFDPMG